MLTMLQNWRGAVEINGVQYANIATASVNAKLSDMSDFSIKLIANTSKAQKQSVCASDDVTEYCITVKQYMTQKASPDFDFMAKWNNNTPMPFRTMIGTVEKETRGMVYMKLHADIYAPVITSCMVCGRRLTNPVSQYFGVGPECGGHNYVHPFDTDEELRAAVASYRSKLQNIKWEGWIIKSAIIEKEEYHAEDA